MNWYCCWWFSSFLHFYLHFYPNFHGLELLVSLFYLTIVLKQYILYCKKRRTATCSRLRNLVRFLHTVVNCFDYTKRKNTAWLKSRIVFTNLKIHNRFSLKINFKRVFFRKTNQSPKSKLHNNQNRTKFVNK